MPRWLNVVIIAAVVAAGALTLVAALVVARRFDGGGRAWVAISQDAATTIVPKDAHVADRHELGCKTPPCRMTETVWFATSSEATATADLGAQLVAKGFTAVPVTRLNSYYTPHMAQAKQFRKGEITVRFYVTPSPLQTGAAHTITPAEGTAVIVYNVDNYTVYDEGLVPRG